MFHKLREKIKKLLKKKDVKKQIHEEMLQKMKQQLKKLDGNQDEASQEEILIIKKTIAKIEKELED
jgi:hypothetical protein